MTIELSLKIYKVFFILLNFIIRNKFNDTLYVMIVMILSCHGWSPITPVLLNLYNRNSLCIRTFLHKRASAIASRLEYL